MGHAAVPRRADKIDAEHGFTPDGTKVTASLYKHNIGNDPTRPKYHFVRACWDGDHIQAGTRYTRQYTGADAYPTAVGDFLEVRAIMFNTRTPDAPAERTPDRVALQTVNVYTEDGEFVRQLKHRGTERQARGAAWLTVLHDTHPYRAVALAMTQGK